MRRGLTGHLCSFVIVLILAIAMPASAALDRVVLQLPWHYQFQFAGYIMALEQGFYAAEGVDVEIHDIDQGGDPVSEVVSGRAQFGIAGSGLLIERNHGKPVVAVAAILQDSPTVFLTLVESGITSPEDFIGKRVMLSPGFLSAPLLALLNKKGLIDQIVRVPTSFDSTALVNNDTDVFNAYLSNEPYLLESQGHRVNIINPQDYGIHFYGDVLFTSTKFLNKKAALVDKFRLATIKGWHYAFDHLDETIAFLHSRYCPDKSLSSLLNEAIVLKGIILSRQGEIGHMDVARWAQITQSLINIGALPENFKLEDDFIFSPPPKIAWSEFQDEIILIAVAFITLLVFLFILSRLNYRAKLALERLEQSEQRYRDLVDRVPGLIYSFQPERGGICYSHDINNILGISVEKLQEQPRLWFDAIHPDNQKQIRQLFYKMKPGETYELEYRIQSHSGKWLWFQDRFTSRISQDNEVIIDGVAVDITDKRLLQEKQAEHDRLLQKALEAVSDGVWEWHVESNGLVLDQRSRELFGVEKKDIYQFNDLFAVIDSTDLIELKGLISEHFNGHSERIDYIFKVHRKNGTKGWLRGRGRILERDSAGKPLRLIGTFVDATKSKLAEAKRLESETRFRRLIEQVARIAIQGYDEQRRVIFWNKASEELYGYTEQEALGQKLEDLIIPEPMKDGVIAAIKEWLETGLAIPAEELILVGKEGQSIPVFSSHIMNKTAEGYELFCADIDMRPVKEAERKRMELEEQLRQSYKMEAIGTMAGGIAHDFNNTLAIILGNVELSLLKIPATSPLKEYLTNAKTTILRAKELVQKILLYSRQGIQNKVSLILAEQLHELIGMLRSTIPTSVDLQLNVTDTSKQIRVLADPTQLQQIVLNLCNNGVQAMHEKGLLLITLDSILLHEKDLPKGRHLDPGIYGRIAVKDNGCGIAPEDLDKVFDPFFTTKDVGKGTGMGLSVVQGIVDSHNGFISAQSEPGKGSTFTVYLPLIDERPEAVVKQEPGDDPIPHGSEHLLLIDDEDGLLEVSKSLLEEHGYQVTAINDAQHAIDVFNQYPKRFDLIITDQTMPGLTGLELAEIVLKTRPELPIILCSGYNLVVNEQNDDLQGISVYMQKPLNLDDLARQVRVLLDAAKTSL